MIINIILSLLEFKVNISIEKTWLSFINMLDFFILKMQTQTEVNF